MYEENRVSIVGRLIWAIVSLLVLAALVWLVLWLLFWRSPKVDEGANTAKITGSSAIDSGSSEVKDETDSTKNGSTNTTPSNNSSTSTDTAKSNPNSGSTSATTPSTATSSTAGQTSSTSTKVPSGQLANTGAGDVLVPVVAVVAGATAFYQIRLRRSNSL